MGVPRFKYKPKARLARRAPCSVWVKRNWVLISFIGLAVTGAVLSILLLFEPCDKETKTTVLNRTSVLNVTYNETRLLNVTRNVTSAFNVTRLENATRVANVTSVFNETVVSNVTTYANSTVNATYYKPFHASLLLDASKSVSAEEWVAVKSAAVALANVTAGLVRSTLEYGVVQWGCDAVESVPPAAYAPRLLDTIAGLDQAVQLQTLNVFALMDCYDHFAGAPSDDAKLCQFITDGAPTEAERTWTDEDVVVKKASYNGAPIWCNVSAARGRGWCDARRVANCTLLGVTDFLESAGYIIHIIVVEPASNYDSGMMYQLSSCDTGYSNGYFSNYAYGFGGANDQDVVGMAEFYRKGGVDEAGGTSICASPYWPGFRCDAGCSFVTEVESYETIVADAQSIVDAVVVAVGSERVQTSRTDAVTTTTSSVVTERTTTTETSTVTERTTVTESTTDAVVDSTLVTSVEAGTEIVTDSEVLQERLCTGSGVSFFWLLLGAPLLAYLFLKPLSNLLRNCCAPEPEPAAEEAVASSFEMSMNPVWGVDTTKDDPAPPPMPRKERSAIDTTLNKRGGKKKKKYIGPRGSVAGPPPATPAATPVPAPPTGPPPRAAKKRASLIQAHGAAKFDNGLMQVYNGDKWQEDVADFVIGLLCCRCLAKAPEPPPSERPSQHPPPGPPPPVGSAV